MSLRHLTIDRGDAHRRIDQVLVARLPGLPMLSRTRIQQLIRGGSVRIDGRPASRVSQRVAEGQRVEIDLPERPRRRHEAQPVPLAVLFEDEWLIAVDKPAGMVVHPTRRYPDSTLVNALLWRERDRPAGASEPGAIAQEGDDERTVVRLVHRLDRQTSGVLLAARSRAVHAALARAMARRAIDKHYLALVYGAPGSARTRIDLGIARDPATGRQAASKRAGRPASTIVELIARSPGARGGVSLLRCTLVTGRLHQIRVHLAAVGCPIVGDAVYGQPRWKGLADPALARACAGFTRQALHAWRICLTHPVTRRPLSVTAPLPADLRDLLAAARIDASGAAP